jgi:hypothetical protein
MDEHVPDCVVTEYEALIPTLTLPHVDDRHVLAAAIYGGAGIIITFNLSDFPASVLGQFHIEAIHPDEFITRLWDEHSDAVLHAMRLHRASLKNPPKSAAEYLATLEQCQLPDMAARIRPLAVQI